METHIIRTKQAPKSCGTSPSELRQSTDQGKAATLDGNSSSTGCLSESAREKPGPADICPQVEIIRETDKERHAQAMGDSELCQFIAKAVSPVKKILRDNLAYIAEARKRFAQPGKRVPVPGKPTWGNWIKQNLGISDRHARRLLAAEREPHNHKNKPEPRVEVESAGIIFGNKGLEMARKLRDGDVDAAKRIAAEMLEADVDSPESLLSPPLPEPLRTMLSGPAEKQIEDGGNKTVAKLDEKKVEKLKEIADLATEAFIIVNGRLGDRLMGYEEGRRLVSIAKEALAARGTIKLG